MWSRERAGSVTRVRAVGPEAREQNRTLDLRRSDGRDVVQRRRSGAPAHGDGQATTLGRVELDAHPGERVGHSAHGALRERLVTRERCLYRPSREHAHEKPYCGAAVAAVDRRVRSAWASASPAANRARERAVLVLRQLDVRAKCADRFDARSDVSRIKHAMQFGRAFGHRREEHGAMRQRLVARQVDVAGQWWRSRPETSRHASSPASLSGVTRGSYPRPSRSATSEP